MIKFYKIIFLFCVFIIFTTFNPKHLKIYDKKKSFFRIESIEILNNDLISSEEIINKLDKIYNKNIILLKREEIEKPLSSMIFFKDVEVKKKYPDKIILKISETKPIAFFFKNKQKYLIDDTSNFILLEEHMSLKKLPIVFGENGENNLINFFSILIENSFPTNQIENFYYFKVGRWDIDIINGQKIKFPIDKTAEAIKESIKLLKREDFKKYNIIDLRINGKIIAK